MSSLYCHGASAWNTTLDDLSTLLILRNVCTLHSLRCFVTCEISSSWFTLYSMTNSVSSSVGRTLLRYHVRVALSLARHWALAHHWALSSCLRYAFVCAVLCSWSCLGHPQPPDRSQHGCTVGVNRDPPVWPSTQAGWWRNQSASPTYVGRRATISRRRGL